MDDHTQDAVENALTNYHELNAALVDELPEAPSALEFMRYVAINRPFVVRGAAAEWDAVKKWNASYLREIMKGQRVNVAVTQDGNADAVLERKNGTLVFVEPYEIMESFTDFLDYVQADVSNSNGGGARPVKYAQTQNDNLREEYVSLFEDVPSDIPSARIALDKEPEAINMWIGNERSVTSLHKDNYENMYVQIRGQKHFVLLPPIEMPCVNEQSLPQAWYTVDKQKQDFELKGQTEIELMVHESKDQEMLPVPTWDPDLPEQRTTRYSHFSQPLRVTLGEGDMLYLPALWYHKVSQTAGEEGFACAVNYWYDMDFSGGFWTSAELMRDLVSERDQVVQYPELKVCES